MRPVVRPCCMHCTHKLVLPSQNRGWLVTCQTELCSVVKAQRSSHNCNVMRTVALASAATAPFARRGKYVPKSRFRAGIVAMLSYEGRSSAATQVAYPCNKHTCN